MSDGLVTAIDPDFEQRWAAWQERGRAHDRLFRKRLMIVLPGIALVAVIVVLLFR